jgi:cytochrome P450
MLFGPRVFHTLHPKNVEAVLSTNFKGTSFYLTQSQIFTNGTKQYPTDYGFGARRSVFSPLLGNGIFTQEGPAWKHSRELLRKQFIRTQYQNLDHFQEHVNNLITRLPVEGGVVDLQPLFFSLTLDTTTALLLGRSVHSLRADDTDDAENIDFAESFNVAQEGLAKRFRIAPWHFFYNPPEFQRACSTVHRFVESYIQERNVQHQENINTEESYGFINQVAEESATNEDLRDQLLNVLLAGRDTTACCLSWTLYVFSLKISAIMH